MLLTIPPRDFAEVDCFNTFDLKPNFLITSLVIISKQCKKQWNLQKQWKTVYLKAICCLDWRFRVQEGQALYWHVAPCCLQYI